MMKKYISFLLVLILMLSAFPMSSFAAKGEPEFNFELSIDGKDTKEVVPGEIITVSLHLNRIDANTPYTMYAMQDEIRYDSNFFRLVEGSAVMADGINYTDISILGGYREFYMNYLSYSNGKQWEARKFVGSFKLEVIADSGVSTITNEDYMVSYESGMEFYPSEANFLTVVVSTDCTVRFATNGGTKVDDVRAIYGEKLSRPADPTRDGKVFAGWYKDVQLTQPWDFDKDTVKGNMTLYAKWKDAELPPTYYTLSFNTNNGVLSFDPSGRYVAGTEIVLPNVTSAGFIFTGWDDGNKIYSAGDKFIINSTVTLVAHWKAATPEMVAITFNGGGGVIANDPSGEYKVGTELVLPTATREGYTFKGWNDGKNILDAGISFVVGESITFEAVWEKLPEEKVNLTLNPNGGTVKKNPSGEYAPGSEVILPAAEREGFVFKGWNDGTNVHVAGTAITLTSDVSMTAVWESGPVDKVTLKLDLNGGKLSWDPSGEHAKGTVLKLPEPNREGFVFKGWKLGKVVYAAGDEVTLNESMTFKASWEKASISAEKVTYTLDLDGGTLAWDPSGEYPIGTVVKLPDPYRAGYVLDYWECNGKIYAATMEITLNSSMSFKAIWKEAADEPVWKPSYNIDSLITDKHINYVVGYSDGTILPKNNITRAEVAVIFYRLLSEDFLAKYESTNNNYLDVKDGMWHNKAISTLSNAGILTGYPDGNFYPNKNITRAELAAIIDRFAVAEGGESSFSDVAGHWAYDNIATAEVNGWITGYPDGTFQPNKAITRAETFAVVNRLLGRYVNSFNCLLPGMNQFIDNMNTSAWYYFDVQEATNNHDYTRLEDGKYERWTKLLENIVY
ncbi:MAG: InlB B-repeat-containing protein [Oscillospiraceae bacterium]|nr:InlB B-repeat-containing protein [Oscillospiraceae bacterium]